MRTVLGTLLGAIAAGVLLIAYGLLSRQGATVVAAQRGVPVFANETVGLGTDMNTAGIPPLQLRCEPGQRAVIRQVAGAAAAECLSDGGTVSATRAAMAYPTSDVRTIREVQPGRVRQAAPAARRVTTERGKRDWTKTAMVIGGTSASGAGIGALFGGKKGALIGAAIGGGAGTLWEVKH